MAVMRVDHPDILEFIHCKDKEGEIVNFNISVGLTNEFMEKVANNNPSPWMCSWNGKKIKPHRVYRNDRFIVTEIVEETMTAREIFEEIISSAWNNSEPGCVFLDKVNETNPLPELAELFQRAALSALQAEALSPAASSRPDNNAPRQSFRVHPLPFGCASHRDYLSP